ncbi:MAG TPA: PP2C family protein-serine/threonine phosphatase [Thermoanaerobaculia bacterium]|nr:PP2C family protein-serine/threonine phosphatase [Thermoanaerobaculia bacterium]
MDYKRLLSKVEKTVEAIEGGEGVGSTIASIATIVTNNFRDELGITGGRIYEARGDDTFELVARFGDDREAPLGIVVPREYKAVELVLENGIVVMGPGDPAFDPVLEARIGARRFVAVAAGDGEYIVSFDVAPELGRDDILFSLNLIRSVITQRIRAQRYESLIEEAQRIQASILPQRVPQYPGFDIWGKTVPAEIVSGDFYDFIPITDNILGLAIADGSGHGLPAALVVRDIYMGLRMATDRDFKIVRTMEKLNHIIHRSRLTTKFVSCFYGELETGGILIYSNAGHNPPFILRGNHVEYLRNGGPVFGPTPDATYTRGYAKLDASDLLCLYTDGIVEAHDRQDREFGLERLQRVVKQNRTRTSQEIGQEVLTRVTKWSRSPEDDRTIVIVKAVTA